MKHQKVILLLGGNDKDSFGFINHALYLIQKETGSISTTSSYYTTAAWGPVKQPDFINIALVLHTILPPVQLLKKLLDIEVRLGRKRTVKYGPRTIDIDILFYGGHVIRHPELQVPHPQIPARRFVLTACDEIIPGFRHPLLGLTIRELLANCKDELEVKKWIS